MWPFHQVCWTTIKTRIRATCSLLKLNRMHRQAPQNSFDQFQAERDPTRGPLMCSPERKITNKMKRLLLRGITLPSKGKNKRTQIQKDLIIKKRRMVMIRNEHFEPVKVYLRLSIQKIMTKLTFKQLKNVNFTSSL